MLSLLKVLYIDLGIDLGTANTILFARDRGFIINEASCIALDQEAKTIALGNEAKRMLGKTAATTRVIRPLKDGVIADFDAGDALIKGFIQAAKIRKFRVGRVATATPSSWVVTTVGLLIDSLTCSSPIPYPKMCAWI